MKAFLVLLLLAIGASATTHAEPNRGNTLSLNEMNFTLPDGWTLVQDGLVDNITILALAKGEQSLTLFARPQGGAPTLTGMYTSNAQGPATTSNETFGPLTWQSRDTTHMPRTSRGGTQYVHGFQTTFGGYSYYGFSRGNSASEAKANAAAILSSLRIPLSRSITNQYSYSGKKYYLGWGTISGQGSQSMVNEVKYDVKHTHDIFTKDVGGTYSPTTMFENQVSGSSIRNAWSNLTKQMTSEDMFVQYSGGHGYEGGANSGGLSAGVTYRDIRDAVLAMPARELIIFTMACFSGGLVDSFNQKKSTWQNWKDQGRTLFVFASSQTNETSSTGPGTDSGEPGPQGSAGSAYGYALWKALTGEADGFVDGVKDGFVSLEEIRDFVITKAQRFNQTPVVTGSYNPSLIMNKVPTRAFVESLEAEGGSENLSEDQLMERIEALDAELRVH